MYWENFLKNILKRSYYKSYSLFSKNTFQITTINLGSLNLYNQILTFFADITGRKNDTCIMKKNI